MSINNPCPTVTRRRFMQGAASLALVQKFGGSLQNKRTFAYVGTYTGAPGGGANGRGIYQFEVNSETGELKLIKLAASSDSPSWLVIHPTKRYLYAANEIADFRGGNGAVSSFAIDARAGDLRFLNKVRSEGAGPAHLSLHPSGKFAFVSNYGSGSIAVLPILANGSLGSATDVLRNTGSVGSTQPANAPRGSFAFSGHDAPHAHMISADPGGRFVLATDLGQDRIYVYNFDSGGGKLIPAATPFVSLPTGDGPRHFAFHPNGNWLYSIQEEASTVVFFLYSEATGALTQQQNISTLPEGFGGSSFASEVIVSADGRFLYAANRLHDTIAVFSIGAGGHLARVGETSTLGDYPSQFAIEPEGRFLYACNRRSDVITSFRIHSDTGLLTFTGKYTPVGSPASITFL